MAEERWLKIPGYEDLYWVSDLGNVRSAGSHHPDKSHKQHVKFGYPKVLLSKAGSVRWFFVHRLVWMAHKGSIPAGMVINHIDHNKGNPVLENLEAITQSENIRQSMARRGGAFLPRDGSRKRRTA